MAKPTVSLAINGQELDDATYKVTVMKAGNLTIHVPKASVPGGSEPAKGEDGVTFDGPDKAIITFEGKTKTLKLKGTRKDRKRQVNSYIWHNLTDADDFEARKVSKAWVALKVKMSDIPSLS